MNTTHHRQFGCCYCRRRTARRSLLITVLYLAHIKSSCIGVLRLFEWERQSQSTPGSMIVWVPETGVSTATMKPQRFCSVKFQRRSVSIDIISDQWTQHHGESYAKGFFHERDGYANK